MSTGPETPLPIRPAENPEAAGKPFPRIPQPVIRYGGVAAAVALAVFLYFLPGLLQGPLNPTEQIRIYYMGIPVQEPACYVEEKLYLPLDLIREYVDETIRWDEQNKLVIITDSENVFHLPLGLKEGFLNLEPFSFTYPVLEQEGKIYLPVDPLQDFYDLEIFEDKDSRLVMIRDLAEPVQMGKTLAAGKLRSAPAARSSWAAPISRNREIRIFFEHNGWFWVDTGDGLMGYLPEEKVQLTAISRRQEVKRNTYPPWNPLEKPVILTWEYAGFTTANPNAIGELAGVSVVSPTWFHLAADGLVINRADKTYVRWAHQQGRLVWGLFDNNFDPDLTHDFLNDATARIKAIKQILTCVELYELDGINLDFENMYIQDKDAYVQFVRELAPLLHEKERTLTVDVTFHSQSENWSRCYDRVKLAELVDYMMVMAYDEHGGGSNRAGSVSSLPWVERGLQRILQEVPPEKLLLGVPFYTRLWTQESDGQGGHKLTSQALSMEKAESWIREHGAEVKEDAASGQHYVEHHAGSVVYKMWLEDDYSLEKRIMLMKKYRLAGIAAWRRGFEKEGIWPAIESLVHKVW